MAELVTIERERMQLNFHPGQVSAWNSEKRYVIVLAGTQGG
jgi:hypothetical protein